MLMTALFLQHEGDWEPRNDVGFQSSLPLSSELILDGHNRTKKMTHIHKNVSHKVSLTHLVIAINANRKTASGFKKNYCSNVSL